jgi:phage terminase Nu1 subunit (DNA packaging protein)
LTNALERERERGRERERERERKRKRERERHELTTTAAELNRIRDRNIGKKIVVMSVFIYVLNVYLLCR